MTKATKHQVAGLAGQENGRKKLGYVVWWAVSRALSLDINIVKPIFAKLGFNEKEMPEAHSAETAFTEAIRIVRGEKIMDGWLVRKVLIADDRIVYRVVREKIDEKAEELDFIREDRIVLRRNTEDVDVEKGIPQTIRIKNKYRILKGKIDTLRARLFLLGQMKSVNALQLREMGGIYFVPIHHDERINAIEKVFGEVSPDTSIYLLPIYDDTKSAKSLNTAFNEGFKAELQDITEEIENRLKDDKTRGATWKNRLDEFKQIRDRAKAYEDLLSFKAQDIHKIIGQLEDKVKKALLEASD